MSGVVRMQQDIGDTLLEEEGHRTSKSDEDNISITSTRASQFSCPNYQRPTSEKHTGPNRRRTSSKSSSTISKSTEKGSSGDEPTPPKKQKSNASKSIEEVPRHSQPETSQQNVSPSIGSNEENSRKRTSTSSKNGTTPGSKSTGSYSKITGKISNEESNTNNFNQNADASAMSDGALENAEEGHRTSKSDEDNISITYTRASQFSCFNYRRPTCEKHTGANCRRTSSKSSSTISKSTEKGSSGDEPTPPKKQKSNASKSIEEVPRHSQPETSQQNVSPSIGSNEKNSRKRNSTSSKNGTTPGSKSTGSYSKITEDFELKAVRERDIRAFPEGSPLLSAPVRTCSKDNDVQPELEEIRMSHHSNAEQNSEEPQAVNEPEASVPDGGENPIVGSPQRGAPVSPSRAQEPTANNTGSPPTNGSPQSAPTMPYVVAYYYCCDPLFPCAISHYNIDI